MYSVAYPPPPPTSNTLPAHQRSALVRSSRKLYNVLGDVPHVPDDNSRPSTESAWRKRKPTHLPPLLKPCSESHSSAYHRPASVLSVSPSIISNAPSSASTDSTQRRSKLERLRRKLGRDLPTTAVFPPSPKPSSRSRPTDDAHSIAFSINSDESVHTVSFSARVHSPSPHPRKTTHVYHTSALPPVPPVPARVHDDDAGLLRPRKKMPAGSGIGGADFKAARRAKWEGKNGTAEPWEVIEMVGFL